MSYSADHRHSKPGAAPPVAQRHGSASIVDRRASAAAHLQLKQKIDESPLASASRSLKQLMTDEELEEAAPAQLMEDEDEPLQGKFAPVQRVEFDDDEEPPQGKFTGSATTQPAGSQEARANNTGLPDNLKSGIENLSGMSMDHVKVHYNSSQPAQLNAHAYAHGSDIHIGPGQEEHLPHEAWHVVQQKHGRVQATAQKKGILINDNRGLEHEADVMGERALGHGRSIKQVTTPPNERASDRVTTNVMQYKLLLDPGTVTYAIEGDAQDYVYIGLLKSKHRYVRYEDLPLLTTQANNMWDKIKAQHHHAGSNMKLIRDAEEANDFTKIPDLAPGEVKYENARAAATTGYLIGIHAPGADFYKDLVKADGPWSTLKFYSADTEDDDKASTMTEVSASELAADYDTFATLMQKTMINQAEPFEKNIGGGADRTAKAEGKIYILAKDVENFRWDSADNPYKEKLEAPSIESVASLDGADVPTPRTSLKIGAIRVVYSTTKPSKARTSSNFYIGGKPFTASKIEEKKGHPDITTPWEALKLKLPVKQHAETFSRRDRGKGQMDAMGKWSANAAVAVSNAIAGTSYNDSLAWEWLHLRGAGLGGPTTEGNLTPGTFSANSEMIPIENKIKSLKSHPDIVKLAVDFEPKALVGIFAKEIEISIRVHYKDNPVTRTGAWTINTHTGSVFDGIHDKKLRQDVDEKTDEQALVGSAVTLYFTSGLMRGPCKVERHMHDKLYLVEVEDNEYVAATLRDDGSLLYDDDDSSEED